MPTIEQTIELIKEAHAGQVDKAGRPYWHHPVSVMNRLGPDASEEERTIALLHDVIEDTAITSDQLHNLGYSANVIAAVSLLSRPEGVAYLDWISSIAQSGDYLAIRVKIADNEDNCDPARISKLPPSQQGIAKRYQKSLQILRQALINQDAS